MKHALTSISACPTRTTEDDGEDGSAEWLAMARGSQVADEDAEEEEGLL
ncbi:hypothetical protein [Paenibacillus prosopidis]|uniref:Uncharacterized protein n=1 Tax=Paenibacillus prosopidis TaxID=630520 RepID=A0A368W910_9BACL|nr:hypothetical protein [Paenibacillus prosopidis]RCW52059.1 hypothetical protein DFP97_101405 [Paenibacillus prosopidis]